MDWIKVTPRMIHSGDDELCDLVTLDFSWIGDRTMTPIQAALHTINEIKRNYPAPYTLMLSGGVDSQAMLWAWMLSGSQFNTLTGRYNDDLNAHDLIQLKEFALRHGVDITFQDIDLLHFLDTEYDSFATRALCSSPQICTHMKLASLVQEGTVIFSGNFVAGGVGSINYAIMGICRYAEKMNKSIVPFFFLETPELAHSFDRYMLTDADAVTYEGKVKTYQHAGFPVIAQVTKQTGFEKVKDMYDETHSHLVPVRDKLTFSRKPSKRTFDLLLRYPYEKKFGNPRVEFINNVL